MISDATRRTFELQVSRGEPQRIMQPLAAALRANLGSVRERMRIAAAVAHAAFAAPERIAEIYDSAATGWFGKDIAGPAIPLSTKEPVPISEDFWGEFWSLVGVTSELGSGDVTTRAATLSGLLDASHQDRVAAASAAYPSVIQASMAGFPDRIELADLAVCPPGSLGEEFYRLIVDNNFDLEVLDRDALGLSRLPAPLDYLNARMLQTHDLWHIVAGYRTTKLHEVAISGFQMAQFGHGYSALFLALVATVSAINDQPQFSLMMDTILGAWVHGRRTPPMLLIPWEAEWTETTASIRNRYDVTPFVSAYPADLFELYEAAA